jgi:RNA polymerase sigma-70 factor (ECF subfamily)
MLTDPPSSHIDEVQRWVEAARDGDQAAWERLHQRYRPLLSFSAQAGLPDHLRGRFDAEDVIQAAFLSAFRGLQRHEYRGEAAFRAWLKEITRNELTTRIRAHEASKRTPEREQTGADVEGLAQPTDEDQTPSAVMDKSQRRSLVLEAMRQLEDEQQELLWMRDFEQRSWEEIARLRGTSTSVVRKGYAKALAALVRLLRRSDLR